MKLQVMHHECHPLQIQSTTKEEWAAVQNILTLNGFRVWGVYNDSFDRFPHTRVWGDKSYINLQPVSAEHYTLASASDFIRDNTPLADLATNDNNVSTHSINA